MWTFNCIAISSTFRSTNRFLSLIARGKVSNKTRFYFLYSFTIYHPQLQTGQQRDSPLCNHKYPQNILSMHSMVSNSSLVKWLHLIALLLLDLWKIKLSCEIKNGIKEINKNKTKWQSWFYCDSLLTAQTTCTASTPPLSTHIHTRPYPHIHTHPPTHGETLPWWGQLRTCNYALGPQKKGKKERRSFSGYARNENIHCRPLARNEFGFINVI